MFTLTFRHALLAIPSFLVHFPHTQNVIIIIDHRECLDAITNTTSALLLESYGIVSAKKDLSHTL